LVTTTDSRSGPARCQGKDLHPHQRNGWCRQTADRADVSRHDIPDPYPACVKRCGMDRPGIRCRKLDPAGRAARTSDDCARFGDSRRQRGHRISANGLPCGS
jgi:hypothetical protein